MIDRRGGSPVPVIVRIAGLPAQVMEPFGSPSCLREVRAILDLERELASLGDRIVERLYAMIKGAPRAVRPALLAIKRDCYNGRRIASRSGSPEWSVFLQAAPDLAARVLELETGLAARSRSLDELFAAEYKRETGHLVGLLDEPNLVQGLALASPEVLNSAARLRRPLASHKRNEKRLAQSALRYASRTAFKLSPFSSLTRVGLGSVEPGANFSPVQLRFGRLETRELRRVKKHIIVKYFTLLRDHPPFRDRLTVQLNPSCQKLEGDRYRFIAPFQWKLNREAREFRYIIENQVVVKLYGPLIEELQVVLREDRPYGELVRLLAARLDSAPAAVEAVVRKLTDIGFLLLLFPWPTNAFDPERRFLAFLDELPPDEVIAELAGSFRGLLELRDTAQNGAARLRGYREIDKLRLRGFASLTNALALPAVKEEASLRQIHEDVFLVGQEAGADDAVARISWRCAVEAFASVRPMVLYSDLSYTRYEFLHTLGELARRQWPQRGEVGFLELFHLAQPLWRDYITAANASITGWRPKLWNPYGLQEVEDLSRLRINVLEEVNDSLYEEEDELVIDRERAARAVDRIPDVYTPALGPCLFAQPATPDGRLWTLSHMLDGTGRFSNRYTTAMPDGTRERFSSHLGRVDSVPLFGEPAEIIEILCARDDHLNVHEVQTRRMIVTPGEDPDLPPERRLGLRDLRVRLDGPLPVLADSTGGRLLPVFLGTNGLIGMPALVRFLSRFGIGEFRVMHPARPRRRGDGVTLSQRLRIGNLVLRRRLWEFSPAPTFSSGAASSDAQLFLAVNQWRLGHGIPTRVFVSERQKVKFDLWPVHKPQFIDFSSPSFTPIFRSILKSSAAGLKLEEMLPTPEAYPVDSDGRRWALEVQLEQIAFHHVLPWKAADEAGYFSSRELSSEVWGTDAHQPSLTAQGAS